MQPVFNGFADREQLVSALADRICFLLTEDIRQQGRAVMAVSGGSTPPPLFRELSAREVDWAAVTVTLVDERWVTPDDPASNEGLVRANLLRSRAAAARFVPLYSGGSAAGTGEGECERVLAGLGLPFTVVILGMGGDGHTASLFPGAAGLDRAVAMDSGRHCLALTPPGASCERMTLTLPVILASREIILHIHGDGKRKVYHQALANGPAEEMPIRYVLRQERTPVQVFWAP